MTDIQSGSPITAAADKVFNRPYKYAYTINLTFFGSNLPQEIWIHPDYILSWSISEDFGGHYAEEQFLTVKLTGWEYITLLQSYQDLKVSLILERVDQIYGTEILSLAPKPYTFKCIIENAENILKEKSVMLILPQEDDDSDTIQRKKNIRVDLTLQLIDEFVYNLRHPRLNGILNNCTVEDAIKYFAESFGIDKENLYYVPPDNTAVIPNLIIPPYQAFSECLLTIQKEYGIYLKGVGYYYFQGELYIYPAGESEMSFYDTTHLHIFKAADTEYQNMEGYCKDVDGSFQIITLTAQNVQSSSEKATENEPSGMIVMDANKAVDDLKEANSVNTNLKEDNLEFVGVDNPRSVASEAQNVGYAGLTSNITDVMATVAAATSTDLISCSWLVACPHIIPPKQPVTFHYMDAKEYKTQNGVVDAIVYNLLRQGRPGNIIYTFNAGLALRLTPLPE
jgi:hypothetical protein